MTPTNITAFTTGMTQAMGLVGNVIAAIAEQPVLAFFVGVSFLSVAVGVIRRLRSAL